MGPIHRAIFGTLVHHRAVGLYALQGTVGEPVSRGKRHQNQHLRKEEAAAVRLKDFKSKRKRGRETERS